MYECTDCGQRFEKPAYYYEKHGLDTPPYEKIAVCPTCKGSHFHEARAIYCRFCGARLHGDAADYCNDTCRKQGVRLRRKEALHLYQSRNHPVVQVTRLLEIYNREHGTRYSYGQFVALILPKIGQGDKAS